MFANWEEEPDRERERRGGEMMRSAEGNLCKYPLVWLQARSFKGNKKLSESKDIFFTLI